MGKVSELRVVEKIAGRGGVLRAVPVGISVRSVAMSEMERFDRFFVTRAGLNISGFPFYVPNGLWEGFCVVPACLVRWSARWTGGMVAGGGWRGRLRLMITVARNVRRAAAITPSDVNSPYALKGPAFCVGVYQLSHKLSAQSRRTGFDLEL